jgi:hypothetical protein
MPAVGCRRGRLGPAHLFHRGLVLPEDRERPHLLRGLALADLAHREAHVDQDPVADRGRIILQQAEIHPAAHPGHLHQGQVGKLRDQLDDLAGDG